jgi:hypothetical protein
MPQFPLMLGKIFLNIEDSLQDAHNMPCTLTVLPPVLFGETGCKINSFLRLHKNKSI